MIKNKLLLIVLDGWGVSKKKKGNAILQANPSYFNKLKKSYSCTELNASGEHVGLLPGVIGNSEVGHLHIGSGRFVKQDLRIVIESINDGSFFRNKVLVDAMRKAKNSALHILGLVSDAGVHSHIKSLFALLKMAENFKIKKVVVHAIADGRDVPPKSAPKYIRAVQKKLKKDWIIGSVVGRYFAMDRDKRWDRTKKAYDAIINAKGKKFKNLLFAVNSAYKKGQSDEFIRPLVDEKYKGVSSKDVFVFFNFRPDRALQISFSLKKKCRNFFTMVQYSDRLKTSFIFPQLKVKDTLGDVLSQNKIRQFRLAETEKWAHVTYFFNGLSDRVFKGESRRLISSPKVSTYDKTPAMSALKIANSAVESISSCKYGFILVNFANADMVGHTGCIKPAIKAIKILDFCLKKVVDSARKNNYICIITADHGKAEQLIKNNIPDKAHTANKVPFILVSEKKYNLKSGCLYNVAPTVLELMKIRKPKVMGGGLIKK